MRASWLLVSAFLAIGTGAAIADDKFHAVPDGGGLELRVVSYGKSVHGEMTVEVRNPGTAATTFVATGLYFTPDDNDESQRLGVVGHLRVGSEGGNADVVTIAAGGSRKVRFDVFCVDEHRHAPGSDQAFTLAAARMPTSLIAEMGRKTSPALAGVKGKPTDDQMSDLQGRVWDARRTVKVRLLGEKRR